MALNAKTAAGGGGKRDVMEAGTYPARLVQVVDLGLQPQRPFQGQEKVPAQEILLTYEFLDEFMKDEDGEDILDKPRWLSENFVLHNLRAERAKSTARYKGLDPAGAAEGDFSRLLETPVMVTVMVNPSKKDPTRLYENVQAVAPMRDKDARKAPPLVNSAVFFDLDAPSLEAWEKLPTWLQDRIKGNLEFNGSKLQKMIGGDSVPAREVPAESFDDLDDEIPF